MIPHAAITMDEHYCLFLYIIHGSKLVANHNATLQTIVGLIIVKHDTKPRKS